MIRSTIAVTTPSLTQYQNDHFPGQALSKEAGQVPLGDRPNDWLEYGLTLQNRLTVQRLAAAKKRKQIANLRFA